MAVKLEVVKPLENNRTEIKAYYNNLGEAGARSFSKVGWVKPNKNYSQKKSL